MFPEKKKKNTKAPRKCCLHVHLQGHRGVFTLLQLVIAHLEIGWVSIDFMVAPYSPRWEFCFSYTLVLTDQEIGYDTFPQKFNPDL